MEGDSSKLMEVEEPMEESPAVATSSLKKRKADSDLAEAEEEEEEEYFDSEDEDEEEYVDEDEVLEPKHWWTAPEWDVDSYDGLEYDSAEEEDECSDPVAEKKWRLYKRQLIESKGFYVESGLRPDFCYSGHKPVHDLDMPAGHGRTYRQYFELLARLCLQRYNDQNSQKNGFTVEFYQVIRGNFTTGPRAKSYITFLAREKSDGPLIEYQAKGWSGFKKGEEYPILCRRAPPSSFPN